MNFSVLMSVYYKENPSFLKQALESVWWQTAKPSEIVVVKDGPLTPELDSTLATLAAVMPIKMVPLSKNNGLGKALSIGLQTCSNELIARMDSDDIAKPNRFERELAVFETNPEIDVVGSWVDEFQESTEHIVAHYLWVRMLCAGFHFYNIQSSLLYFRTSADLYKRRGGVRYVEYDLKFQNAICRTGFINKLCMLENILMRVPVRIVPNYIREFLYRFLRKSNL